MSGVDMAIGFQLRFGLLIHQLVRIRNIDLPPSCSTCSQSHSQLSFVKKTMQKINDCLQLYI
jgi:hypothetical protein